MFTESPSSQPLSAAVHAVPGGAWAVGVSGGADSVAMLSLLRGRTDLLLHVVHLDHQARGEQSRGDAAFVAELARRWSLPCTLATRQEIEPFLPRAHRNLSAHFRALRLALFAKVVKEHGLAGVQLAHHADDQAETVLHRLLRGSSFAGLVGMPVVGRIGKLVVCRPMLASRRLELRQYLSSIGQDWREDPSNASPKYARSRLRALLESRPELTAELLKLSSACRKLSAWAQEAAPQLPGECPAGVLAELPEILGKISAGRWLTAHGVPPAELTPGVVDRLIEMARDAASPARADFPRALTIRRRRGILFVDSAVKSFSSSDKESESR